jgi:hypothetical protein
MLQSWIDGSERRFLASSVFYRYKYIENYESRKLQYNFRERFRLRNHSQATELHSHTNYKLVRVRTVHSKVDHRYKNNNVI